MVYRYSEWDEVRDGDIALVVSDWGDSWERLIDLLNSVVESQNPFREIVIMSTSVSNSMNDSLKIDWSLFSERNISISMVDRQESHDYFDWCVAPVKSRWFMYTNS